jgi:hypothetical protein
VDYPGVLGSSHGFFINGSSGQGLDLTYNGAPVEDALQQLETEIEVDILFSIHITDTKSTSSSQSTSLTPSPVAVPAADASENGASSR